jgi:hypothetical protein
MEIRRQVRRPASAAALSIGIRCRSDSVAIGFSWGELTDTEDAGELTRHSAHHAEMGSDDKQQRSAVATASNGAEDREFAGWRR